MSSAGRRMASVYKFRWHGPLPLQPPSHAISSWDILTAQNRDLPSPVPGHRRAVGRWEGRGKEGGGGGEWRGEKRDDKAEPVIFVFLTIQGPCQGASA